MMVPMQYGDTPLDNHFFEKNFQSLKTHTLQSGYLSDILSEKISVISASSGQPTLLHSNYEPEKEVPQFTEKLKSGARICLYGFDLGYHLSTILDKTGLDGLLLAIELNLDILTAALKLEDQTTVFEDRRFRSIYGTDEAEVSREVADKMERITKGYADQLKVLFHAPSFKCIPDIFSSLTNTMKVLLLERRAFFPAT